MADQDNLDFSPGHLDGIPHTHGDHTHTPGHTHTHDVPFTVRQGMLEEATEAVTKLRNKSYGEPDEDFQRIAGLWNALGIRIGPDAAELKGHHVAMLMICLKLSRVTWSPAHRDSWVDAAGYAACGLETAMLQESRENDAQEPQEEAQEGWVERHDIMTGDGEIIQTFPVRFRATGDAEEPDGFEF